MSVPAPRNAPCSTALALWAILGLAVAGTSASTVGEPAAPGPARTANAETGLRMVTYAWDPDAGDPEVPAELGGPGFTGEGWTTNPTFPEMGRADVPQGGSLRAARPDWPATLRMLGKDWNTDLAYQIRALCYESLLMRHPVTTEPIPLLATHWQISEDRMTFRFRLNPEARFSNGEEVTAEDVVASYRIRMDPQTLDPLNQQTFGRFEEPVAVSKYIVEVRCREENWRNFIYFAHEPLTIFPASAVAISGERYLDEFQFRLAPGSGPYAIADEDIVSGRSIAARRRDDWWARDNPAFEGLYNIGTFEWVVVQDEGLKWEKFKAGELDLLDRVKASWYAADIPELDAWKRGMMRRVKVFNRVPKITSGIAINMRRPPLDDLRVRRALAHLCPRELLLDRFMYNEYTALSSYFPGGIYENPDNEYVAYDPLRAVELLEEAGWTAKDADGYRTKDGVPLSFELTYASQLYEPYLTIYQEECQHAGIRIELQLLTGATRWRNMRQKEYDLTMVAWGAPTPPNPVGEWSTELAEQLDNNNVTSFSDPRVDELCELYDQEHDPWRRVEIVRAIDGLVHAAHPYVQFWTTPAERVVIWNKFGLPHYGGMRMWRDYLLPLSWWVDPEREARLAECRADPSATMQRGREEFRYWETWDEDR